MLRVVGSPVPSRSAVKPNAGHFGFVFRRPRRPAVLDVGLAAPLVGSLVGAGGVGVGLGRGVGRGDGAPEPGGCGVGDGGGGDGEGTGLGGTDGGKNFARSSCICARACCSVFCLSLTSSTVALVFAS